MKDGTKLPKETCMIVLEINIFTLVISKKLLSTQSFVLVLLPRMLEIKELKELHIALSR